ncbi:hypothetical protein POF50_028840 [Streptomyces sp. SL13]|uniref:Transmembrane protein n=1 Tax=Streptantibioticus silvisoli TaxID=2705255 RepID=A0AA90KJ45_9ACTN|nr:hypothetical protein [Streptantibioticus silvisoli]MDI5973304.1 hypothetical protein [Streptantibioticus silvisoli]
MRDVAGDPAALERLRVQRSRLADRMRPPWWYMSGFAVVWALIFACPFSARFLPQGVRIWPVLVAALAVICLLQWGLARATGIAVATRSLRDRSGRPAAIATIGLSIAALAAEALLIDRSLLVAAIAVAALAVVAELIGLRTRLRAIRRTLRTGGGTA